MNFNVSEQTTHTFARDQARVRAESLQETFSGSQGLDYLTDISKQLGVSEAYSFLEDARRVVTATESYGANVQTAFVRDFSLNNFGDESPTHIRASMNSLADMAQNDPVALNRQVKGFVSGRGYGWGKTSSQVSSTINSNKDRGS